MSFASISWGARWTACLRATRGRMLIPVHDKNHACPFHKRREVSLDRDGAAIGGLRKFVGTLHWPLLAGRCRGWAVWPPVAGSGRRERNAAARSMENWGILGNAPPRTRHPCDIPAQSLRGCASRMTQSREEGPECKSVTAQLALEAVLSAPAASSPGEACSRPWGWAGKAAVCLATVVKASAVRGPALPAGSLLRPIHQTGIRGFGAALPARCGTRPARDRPATSAAPRPARPRTGPSASDPSLRHSRE